MNNPGQGIDGITQFASRSAVSFQSQDGFGNIVAGALEQTNVAIAQEFIDLISTQRSFPANARVITSSVSLLNDLINIVR